MNKTLDPSSGPRFDQPQSEGSADHLASGNDGWVRIALPVALVRELMGSGRLYLSEVRCMDSRSKMLLQRLGMECCASNLHRAAAAITAGGRESHPSSDPTCDRGDSNGRLQQCANQ